MKKNARVRRLGNVRRSTESFASLRVETLEDRDLLSVAPAPFATVLNAFSN